MIRLITFLWGCVAAVGVFATEAAFYVNYDAVVPTAPLRLHPLSIVHPQAEVDLAAAHAEGNRVIAYLSVGEMAADARYRDKAKSEGLRLRGRNEIWQSDILDLTDKRWADLLVDGVAAAADRQGFDGFFLDTLDSIDVRDRAAGVALLQRLRASFPEAHIMANRGFDLLPELEGVVDSVLVESVYGTFDFEREVYRKVPEEETRALERRLQEVEQLGYEIYVLDYADPLDENRAFEIAAQIEQKGWHAMVSTPSLQGTVLAPWRLVPRRVFSFYGNLATELIDQVKWPVDSFTAHRLQTPLEWLGYEVDYGRVEPGVSLPRLGPETEAIILPRNWEIPIGEEARVVDWLIAQKKYGKKILIWGAIPFNDDVMRIRFLRAFGMSGSGNIVLPVRNLQEIVRDGKILDGAEMKARLLPTDFFDLQAPRGSHLIKSVAGVDETGEAVRVDALFITDWGGIALDPYVVFQRPDFQELWHLDIFAYLRAALGRLDAPIPDATTRQGRRMFLSHIDGDGFINGSETDVGKYSSEVVRDEILKEFPVPVTVSVIEAEVTVAVKGVDPALRTRFERVAREIFQLPNVELASHSYSHPFTWMANDRTSYLYTRRNLALRDPYAEVDLRREIVGSVEYINRELAPEGKKVEVFLWSGNCRPPPEALRLVRGLGIVSMNGGDTLISRKIPTVGAVAPRSMSWGNELQVLAPAQNENVYTNDWEGPLFGTFINVIDTFERTESPRRLKPVNIYYHFYSADFFSSLRALKLIYTWAMEQNLHAVKVSDYIAMAKDARQTTIYSAGKDRWAMVNEGDLQTFRIAPELLPRIDLQRSKGITGWVGYQGEAYLHTDGSPVSVLALVAPEETAPRFPYLESSTAALDFKRQMDGELSFTVSDLKAAQVVLAGLPVKQALIVDINDQPQTVNTSESGRLELSLPAVATVHLKWE